MTNLNYITNLGSVGKLQKTDMAVQTTGSGRAARALGEAGFPSAHCGVAAGHVFHWPRMLARQVRRMALLGVVCALVACGGGGGGGGDAPAVPAKILQLSSPRASQGATGGGEAVLAFRVSLADIASFPIDVSFETSTSAIVGTSCSAGVDYYIPAVAGLSVTVKGGVNNATSGKLTMATSTSSRKINVMVCPRNSTTDLGIQLSWSGGDSSGSVVGNILGAANTDLSGSDRLNDTGITGCADGTSFGLACPQAGYPGQDAEQGRDANPVYTGSGTNRVTSFLFTALSSGAVIQDNLTGLMWEGKTTDGLLHDASSTFTWLNSSGTTNGGSAGTASGGACTSVPAGCDIEKFVAAVNAEKLGGFSDWRVPTAQELSTLVDSGKAAAPTVEASISNQSAAAYWSSSPKAGDVTGAWSVDFNSGAIASDAKSVAKRVRLVRGR